MIQKTSNYDQFKIHRSNRSIDSSNLRKLVNSIRLKNMLEIRPILVNSNMEVIDGQHRLEAAKQLGVEVFFIKQEEDNDADMVVLNNNQKQWEEIDYVNYYASKGSEGHIKFKKFIEKNSINTSLGRVLFLGHNPGKEGSILKKEKFDLTDQQIKEAQEIMDSIIIISDFLKDRIIGKKPFFRRQTFFLACSVLIKTEGFILDTFLRKLDSQLSRIHNCPSTTEYIQMFKALYNYRNPLPID